MPITEAYKKIKEMYRNNSKVTYKEAVCVKDFIGTNRSQCFLTEIDNFLKIAVGK